MHFCQNYAHLSIKQNFDNCNFSVFTEDIYLKLGICVQYPKSNLYYQRGHSNTQFFRIMPFFLLRKTLTFRKISVITENIYLILGMCVHYPKSNPYYQGR